jgi:hypothetical protein
MLFHNTVSNAEFLWRWKKDERRVGSVVVSVGSVKLLLVLASTVILGSESRRTHDHILLSQDSGRRTTAVVVLVVVILLGFCHRQKPQFRGQSQDWNRLSPEHTTLGHSVSYYYYYFPVFCVVAPCSSETARRLGVTVRLHVHGRRVSLARNRQKQAARLFELCRVTTQKTEIFIVIGMRTPDPTLN